MITVIDYKTGGNLFSVCNSLEAIGADIVISSNPEQIEQAEKIIFPGVGSFEKAMQEIKSLGLDHAIKKSIARKTKFLGICVGMQVLFECGHEGTISKGLEIIPGQIEKFDDKICPKIPHMGWNTVKGNASPLFKDISPEEHFYFVHSFAAKVPNELENINKKFPKSNIYSTEYFEKFISHFWDGENLFACQFHPEKSGEAGLKLLKNFINL